MTTSDEWLRVESLDLEAQGVAHEASGKVVFIEGALPGERRAGRITRRKNAVGAGQPAALRRESAQRVRPDARTSACTPGRLRWLQDAASDAAAQVAVKQRALEDNLGTWPR
jgi:23S rRNA (uracil1939-C5)-methyltransferase